MGPLPLGQEGAPRPTRHVVAAHGEVRIRSEDPSSPLAVALLESYLDELGTILPAGFDPDRSTPLARDELVAPRGDFLVVEHDGVVCGCGALRVLEPATAEIKRMWIRPDHRRRGLARLLLRALERRAGELGASRVVLDTNEHLEAALALYDAAGYRAVPAYNDNAYATTWLEKDLS